MPKLLHPDDARARCTRQFARAHLAWLGQGGGSGWPQAMPLGAPSQRDTAEEPAAVRAWVDAWRDWEARAQPGEIVWESRQWPRLGTQRLPVSLLLGSPDDVAQLAGQAARWQRAMARHRRLCGACVWLTGQAAPLRLFDALADAADADFERLLALMRWVDDHPAGHDTPSLQLRQLPVVGLHTKWVEQRRGLITDLALARLSKWAPQPPSEPAGRDLHALLGLVRPPTRMRLRLLGADLRRQIGGLGDIEAPIEELAALPIAPRLALIVENLDSGLALPDLPGAVALMKLGHAVNLLRHLPWLRRARVVVWGDIDTHGFAILDRARGALPQVESVLMDSPTLLSHRALWVEEPQPYVGPALDRLCASERSTFDGLVEGVWGARVRLEQERLPWPLVLATVDGLQQPLIDSQRRQVSGWPPSLAPDVGDSPP